MFNIEIDVTLECNFRCPSCNRLCDIISNNPKSVMTSLDMEKILISLKPYLFKISQINILGGEPTLNPNIFDICNFLNSNIGNNINLILTTNNSHNDIVKKIHNLYPRIRIRCDDEYSNDIEYDIVNKKRPKIDRHLNFLYGRCDPQHIPYNKCKIYNKCGINIFKYLGNIKYYHCSPGKMICILLQKDYLFKNSIEEILDDKTELDTVCSYCPEGRRYKILYKNNKSISKLFKSGLCEYKRILGSV